MKDGGLHIEWDSGKTLDMSCLGCLFWAFFLLIVVPVVFGVASAIGQRLVTP